MKVAATTLTSLMAAAAPAIAGDTAQDWTGTHLGLIGGFERMHNEGTFANSEIYHNNTSTNLGNFGLLAGYDYQDGAMLAGIEAEGSLVSGTLENGNEFDVQWRAALRGRLGYVAGNSLFYVTGGPAWQRVTCEENCINYEASKTYPGFQVGAGLEQAVTDKLSIRGEYLYSAYASQTHDVEASSYYTTNKFSSSAVRIGVNYRF